MDNMKYMRTEWWVEYNFEGDVAMNIAIFDTHEKAERFAEKCDGTVIETKCYKVI